VTNLGMIDTAAFFWSSRSASCPKTPLMHSSCNIYV
jgi:hypothetical protein